MTKQMETQEQNTAEQKSSDEELRQREVRSVRLAANGSDKTFHPSFVPDTHSGEVRASCDEDQPAERRAKGAEGEG